MSRIFKFFELTPSERRLFLKTLSTLYLVKILLFVVSFKKLRAWSSSLKDSQKYDAHLKQERIEAVRQALRRAQPFLLWKKSACLTNALVAQRLLSRRGICSVLTLGAAKRNAQLSAHAWLEADGRNIVGGEFKNQFAKVASFET